MAKEYFPFTGKIPFEGKESKNVMAFHYYDPEKVVMGKKMKDWLKFAMAWWHTLGGASGDQFGGQTRSYEWDKADDVRKYFQRLYLLFILIEGIFRVCTIIIWIRFLSMVENST